MGWMLPPARVAFQAGYHDATPIGRPLACAHERAIGAGTARFSMPRGLASAPAARPRPSAPCDYMLARCWRAALIIDTHGADEGDMSRHENATAMTCAVTRLMNAIHYFENRHFSIIGQSRCYFEISFRVSAV